MSADLTLAGLREITHGYEPPAVPALEANGAAVPADQLVSRSRADAQP